MGIEKEEVGGEREETGSITDEVLGRVYGPRCCKEYLRTSPRERSRKTPPENTSKTRVTTCLDRRHHEEATSPKAHHASDGPWG